MACIQVLTLSNVRGITLPRSTWYSLRGVAFDQLGQCMPVLVAVRHRGIWDSGHFHDMGVVSWVCMVDSSFEDELMAATSKDKIIWECENGGQLWGSSEEAGYGNSTSFPNAICGPGWHSLFTAFIVSLLVDLAFQVRKKILPRTAVSVDIPHFLFFVGLGL